MTVGDTIRVVVDTSVAVSFLVETHDSHASVRKSLAGERLVLASHSLAETYSVLTRLPGEARLAPADATSLIDANFGETVLMHPAEQVAVHRLLARANVVGGAVYDALVAIAAMNNGLTVATRDARARGTYAAIGATVRLIAS